MRDLMGTTKENISTVKKSIICFVLLTFAISGVIWFLMVSTGMTFVYNLLLMWTPGIAAIITALVFFRSIKGFGWGPGKIKYLALGIILPVLLSICTYGLFWLIGGGLGTYTGKFGNLLIFSIIVSIFLGLGEEIGWRGFLVPQIAKLTNSFTEIGFLSGIIWAFWHFPVILMGSYVAEVPLWWSLPIFLVGNILFAFVLAWFRLKSGSIWPVVLWHGLDNNMTKVFTPLFAGGASAYYVGESGIITIIPMLILVIILWYYRDRLPDLRIKNDEKVNS